MARNARSAVAVEEPPVKEKHSETKAEFLQSMALVLAVGLFIITFCLQAFEIPSSSMENTLLIGDHVFVDRDTMGPKTSWMPLIPYHEIRDQDIIVFLHPAETGLYVVKRVIGQPGDRIHLKDGIVYRNGKKLDETSYVIRNGSYNPYRDNFPNIPVGDVNIEPTWHLTMNNHIQNGELVVPPDSFFAMGDNRDVSYDSRYWGFIPRENIVGRPMFIYWSFETPPGQYLKTSIADRLAFMAKVVIHFFTETRWSRMLHLVR